MSKRDKKSDWKGEEVGFAFLKKYKVTKCVLVGKYLPK